MTRRIVPVSSGHTVRSLDTDVGVDTGAAGTAKLIIVGAVAVAVSRLQAVGAQSPGQHAGGQGPELVLVGLHIGPVGTLGGLVILITYQALVISVASASKVTSATSDLTRI